MLHDCVDNRYWAPVVAHIVTGTEFPIIDLADWEFLFQLLFLRKGSSPPLAPCCPNPTPQLLPVEQELKNAAGRGATRKDRKTPKVHLDDSADRTGPREVNHASEVSFWRAQRSVLGLEIAIVGENRVLAQGDHPPFLLRLNPNSRSGDPDTALKILCGKSSTSRRIDDSSGFSCALISVAQATLMFSRASLLFTREGNILTFAWPRRWNDSSRFLLVAFRYGSRSEKQLVFPPYFV